jgi:hypothetical protein
MGDASRRRELRERYRQTSPEAGVYRIVNRVNGRSLLGHSLNLASVRNKLEFAQSTNTPSALDHRLSRDAQQFGLDAFSVEVLDSLEVKPEMTREEVLEDLRTLEDLWRQRLDPALLY